MRDKPVEVRRERVKVEAGGAFALWVGRRFWRLAIILRRNPAAAIITLAACLLLVALAASPVPFPAVILIALIGSTVAGAVWAVKAPGSFDRLVRMRIRGYWRSLTRYRRRWGAAVRACELDRDDRLPLLLGVSSDRYVDKLRVEMTLGQQLADYGSRSGRLAQTFGALSCRIYPQSPQELEAWMVVRDRLVDDVPVFGAAEADLLPADGIRQAVREDGALWRLPIIGNNILLGGRKGSGKSGALWSIIWELAPAKLAGIAQLWVIDPKGGQELGPGAYLFDRFVYGEAKASAGRRFAKLLEDAVVEMRRRQQIGRLREMATFRPSREFPLIVVFIDEWLALAAWSADRLSRKRIEAALLLLLTQNRSTGVSVVAVVQDASKAAVPMRDHFGTRAAFGVNETTQAVMLLGEQVRDHLEGNALLADLPGVALVREPGLAAPVRVRWQHVDAAIVATLRSAPRSPSLTPSLDDDDDGDPLEVVLAEAPSDGASALPLFGGFDPPKFDRSHFGGV